MEQIGVDGKRRFAALVLRDRDLVLLGEFEEPLSRLVKSHSRQGAITLMSGSRA